MFNALSRRRFLGLLAGSAGLSSGHVLAQPAQRASAGAPDILIGQVAPFSGPQGHYGQAMAAGIRAKFSAVNAAGGIQGRKLRLLTADDQFNPSETISAYDSLASQGIVAFVGNFGTPTTLKALPWIARHKIPVVGVYSGAQAIRSPVNPEIFNLRGSLLDEAAAIRQLLEPQGISRIAVLYESDAYGQAGLQAILSTYGDDVPSAPLDVGASAAKVQNAVAMVLRAKPQVIVLVLTTKIAIAAVQAIHAAGFHGVRQQVVALSGVGPGAFAAGLPQADRAGVLVSTIVPFPWMNGFIARSLTLDYKADMDAAQSNDAVGFSSMEGYIDASVLVRGLMAAKSVNPASITESLNGLGSFDLGGYLMRLSATDHQATHFANVVYIRPDGTFLGG